LAGSEAALQLLNAGIPVEIYDLKPNILLPAYTIDSYCELICNNSLGNINTLTPLGLLLAELDILGSRVLKIARNCIVDDSSTLSVDRVIFSQSITHELKKKGAKFIIGEVTSLPDDSTTTIISTGPLTSASLALDIANRYNISNYTFYDASCPIVEGASIDLASPYLRKISNDLLAINITDDIFQIFVNRLQDLKEWEEHLPKEKGDAFVQCHSLEKLSKQSSELLRTIRFSSEGYESPTLLLRRESSLRDAFILVGCMTGLGHKEQKEVFSLLPALNNIKFICYGRQHRNTFFKTPGILDEFFRIKNQKNDIFLIGQLSGLDGYAPAIASGFVAAQRIIKGIKMASLPRGTMMGELARYVSDTSVIDYQPMCASFALFDEQNKEKIQTTALQLISEYLINNRDSYKES
jgi:methylenetetrahydrofolate--tRNA-(uracil-5-)-methyltransferase